MYEGNENDRWREIMQFMFEAFHEGGTRNHFYAYRMHRISEF